MTTKKTFSRERIADSFAIGGASTTVVLALVALFLSNERSVDSSVLPAVAGLVIAGLGVGTSFIATRVSRSEAELELVRSALQGLILQVAGGFSVAPSKVSADVYTVERSLTGNSRTVRRYHERIASFEDVSYSKNGDIAERVTGSNSAIKVGFDGGVADQSGERASVIGVPINKWSDGPVVGALLLSMPLGVSDSSVDDRYAVTVMEETSVLLSLILSKG